MAGHTRWSEIKAQRPHTLEMREAYDRAEHAFQFGECVRRAREEAGISQSELARRMGAHRSTVLRLELGGLDPKLSTIERINRALGTELVIEFRKREAAGAH